MKQDLLRVLVPRRKNVIVTLSAEDRLVVYPDRCTLRRGALPEGYQPWYWAGVAYGAKESLWDNVRLPEPLLYAAQTANVFNRHEVS